jgi:hypothetical protein
VIAIGDFMRPALRGDTLEQIAAAGGEVVESQLYHLVHLVPGADPTPDPAPAPAP